MPGEHIGPDAAERVASLAATHGSHAALAAVGIGAAVLRLATHSGPVRPWRAVALDCAIQMLVGFAVAESVYGWAESQHLAVGAGVASGLIGWETLKRIAAARLEARRGVMAENQRAPAWGDPKADLEALAPQERRRWVLRYAIEPALAELPPMPSPRWAKVMLLAIAGVESGCLYRAQVPVPHARGLWQFERMGGVAGVLQHRATAGHAAAALRRRQIPAAPDEAWRALERDDVLAAIFARLLLLSDTAPLPDNPITGREVYMRTWRPGKPSSTAKWADCWWMAEMATAAV